MKTKLLAMFMAVVMLFSVLTVGATAESVTEVPEGYVGIYTVEEFDNIRNDTTGNYILMTDLDFSVMPDDYKWKRISGFKGIFNGNEHIIKGLNDGLFDSVSSATISDVKLVDISSDGPALAKSINNTIVNNIVVADFVMTNEKGGKLSSFINSATNSRIENCSVSATVKITSGQTVFGGILSENNKTPITNCYTDGTADIKATTGGSIIAGIVPTNENSEILYCYNNMDLKLRSIYDYSLRAGGICYRSAANIQCCVNTGDIFVSAGNASAGASAYGITYGNGDVINCLNTGSVRALKPTDSGVGDGGTAKNLGSDVECSIDLSCKGEYITESVYFLNDGTSSRVNALTAEEMKYEENFSKLDFENIWYIDLESGVEHPQLKGCPIKKTNALVIDIPEEIKTIDVDETFALNATIYPKTAEDKLIYTSSNETVATVSDEGIVTAINPGYAVITITAENGTTTQCRLTVNAHIFGEITIITDATCSTEGLAIHICDTCGKTETVIIEKNPDSHKAQSFYTVDIKADCENDGVKSHHCEYCNAPLDNVLIEKRGHNYSCITTKEPDCEEKGINTFVCRNAESTEYKACNSVYTEDIPSYGHSHTAVVTAPTCTEDGYTTYTCACGDSYVADYVDATGHSHTSEITTPATHLTEGVMTFTCACGDTDS